MIGDSPDVDILGANRANWTSILVGTGIDHLSGDCIPDYVVENVDEAIDLILNIEHIR